MPSTSIFCGAILVIIGLAGFFSAFRGNGSPRLFWCCFVGMPLLFVGSVMCMFGFNAGGGSYMPRQGSFMIQCEGTIFGLTGPAVVNVSVSDPAPSGGASPAVALPSSLKPLASPPTRSPASKIVT